MSKESLETIKDLYPEDYPALKRVEPLIDVFFEYKKMTDFGLNIQRDDFSFKEFEVINIVKGKIESWQTN